MFPFNFKRASGKQVVTEKSEPKPTPDNVIRQKAAQAAALYEAQALTGDEAAAVEFILQCHFADARLHAAEHIHSKLMLDRVLQHVRNIDRRVAKLMLARLDVLKHGEDTERNAQSCIEAALRLVQDSQCLPNQVAELDRTWQLIEMPPVALHLSFGEVRIRLGARLEAQAQAQRAALNAIESLRNLNDHAATVCAGAIVDTLDALEREIAAIDKLPEAASLPKHLIGELEHQHAIFRKKRASIEQGAKAASSRDEKLRQWESREPASLKVDAMQRDWQSLGAVGNEEAGIAMQARFDTLVARALELKEAKASVSNEQKRDAQQVFSEALDAMETALDTGAVQAAAEHDKTLRAMDIKPQRLDESQTARLAKARAELGRLQGWAKWGGNVSREELLKAAEDMPQKSLTPLDLSKKVGGLRERWKSLDTSAGPANKELWTRFDAACTAAYAPAAAHFKKLAEERQQHMACAAVLIDEVKQFALRSNCMSADTTVVDWKAVANFCRRMTQSWHRLGAMDRKEKKRLDAEFGQAMQVLTSPLADQSTHEITGREKLIAEVHGMSADDRGVLDALRAIQERWQLQAKAFPLERNEEQALWQRFRSECDAVFAKRKDASAAADAERRKNFQAKELICAALEAAATSAGENGSKALREAKEAWTKVGAGPRATENQIDSRYKSAMSALEKELHTIKLAAIEAESNALRDKLRICREVEAAVMQSLAADPRQMEKWRDAWQVLPKLPATFERAMRERLDVALIALEKGDASYADTLEKNRAVLLSTLLRCEILFSIDSPPECSRERLKLQVEVLQASLKAGQKSLSPDAQLLQVCALPVNGDGNAMQRLERVIANFKNDRTK